MKRELKAFNKDRHTELLQPIKHPSITLYNKGSALMSHNGRHKKLSTPAYFEMAQKSFNFGKDDFVVLISGWVYFEDCNIILRRLAKLTNKAKVYFFVEDVFRIVHNKHFHPGRTFDTYLLQSDPKNTGAMELEIVEYLVNNAGIKNFEVFSGERNCTHLEERYGFPIKYYDWFLSEQNYLGIRLVDESSVKTASVGRNTAVPFADIIPTEYTAHEPEVERITNNLKSLYTAIQNEGHTSNKATDLHIHHPLLVASNNKFILVGNWETYEAYKRMFEPVGTKKTDNIMCKVISHYDNSFENHAVCLNRRFDWHRYIMATMIADCPNLALSMPYRINEQNLMANPSLKFSKFSKNMQDKMIDNNKLLLEKEYYVDFRPAGLYDDKLKEEIDIDDMDQFRSIYIIQNSFLNVATETRYYSPMPYVSEKTLKAAAAMRPFIIAGPPGSLQLMKDLGFKTFSKWLDESYDEETNHEKRLEMIGSEVSRICRLPKSQLDKMLVQMEAVLIHNTKALVELPYAMKNLR